MPSKWFSSLHAAISALLRLAPVCGNGCGTRSLEQQIAGICAAEYGPLSAQRSTGDHPVEIGHQDKDPLS
jgi:hypothetical protein